MPASPLSATRVGRELRRSFSLHYSRAVGLEPRGEAASGKHPSAGQVAAMVRVMDPARLDTMKRLLRNMLRGSSRYNKAAHAAVFATDTEHTQRRT
jgi:hypothetical protein